MTDIRSGVADSTLRVIAHGQYGVFSRQQALDAGLTRGQVTARLAAGAWSALYPGVLIASSTRPSPATRANAARLYCGDRAWFSHVTAARLLGVDPLITSSAVWLTVPADVVRRPRAGLVITRSRRIDGFTTSVQGQPTLTAARTIVDLAQLLDGDALRRVIYDVVARRLVTAEQVLSAAQDFGGRAGLALLGRVLDEFDDAFDSALEAEADQRFREAGLVFDRQVEVWDHGFLVARLDFADEQRRLGIEIDGARYHSGPEARRRDRLRDRELHRLGWQIVRFGADDVRRAWRDMVQRLHMLTNDSRDAERWTA